MRRLPLVARSLATILASAPVCAQSFIIPGTNDVVTPSGDGAGIPTFDISNALNWWQQLGLSADQVALLQESFQILQLVHTLAQNNTTGLQNSAYRNLSQDLQTISRFAQQANLLQGGTGQMVIDLGTIGGYQIPNDNWQAVMTSEYTACANGVTQAGQVFNLQPDQLFADAQTLSSLFTEIIGDIGRMQSLQTLGGITSTMGGLVQKMQGTLAASAQGQITCQVSKMHRQMLLDAMDEGRLTGAVSQDCISIQTVGGISPAECQ